MNEVPFKILSIDGGGIKGLYSAIILKKIQDEFCEGNHISEYFDMICGTSTGGIIALGLTTKTDLSLIIDLYENKGKEIFPSSGKFAKIKQACFRGKYLNKNLKKYLSKILEETTLGEANNLLCIPSYNIILDRPKIWKYPHKEGSFSSDRNVKMVDVALATSAAPTYFPVHEVPHFGKHIDGGIWANNPSLCGVIEAVRHFLNKEIKDNPKLKFNSIKVLSLGSVNTNNGEAFKTKNNRSYFNWGMGQKLIQNMMTGTSFGMKHMTSSLLKGLNNNSTILRVETDNVSKNHSCNIDMDLVSNHSIKLLKNLAEDKSNHLLSNNRHEIDHFFYSFKNYKTI